MDKQEEQYARWRWKKRQNATVAAGMKITPVHQTVITVDMVNYIQKRCLRSDASLMDTKLLNFLCNPKCDIMVKVSE